MKTDSSMTSRQPLSGAKPVLEQLRAGSAAAARGTGKGQDALASLSFRALFADIQVKPGSFEDMTQKMAERRAEQGRLERERGRSRPRAEDVQPASTPEPQRAAGARPARPEESRNASRTPERVEGAPRREREPVRNTSRAAQGSRPAEQDTGARKRTQATAQDAASPRAAAQPAQAGNAPRQASGEGQDTNGVRDADTAGVRTIEADTTTTTASASETSTASAGQDMSAATAARGAAQAAEVADAAQAALQHVRGARRAGADAATAAREAAPGARIAAGTDGQPQAQAARAPLPGNVAVMQEPAHVQPVTNGAQVQTDAPVDGATLQQLAQDMGLAAQAADAGATTVGKTARGNDMDPNGVQVAVEAEAGDMDAATIASMTDAAQGTLRRAGGSGTAATGAQAGRGSAGQAGAVTSNAAAQGARTATVTSSTASASDAGQGAADPDTGASAAGRAATASASNGDAPPLGGAGVARSEGTPFSLGMATQAGSTHSPSRVDGSPLLSSRIDSSIHSAEFKEQFARQVAGVVVQGQDRAEIRLTPAELGPIRIRIALNADDAALDISAAHAATRAAIESSMHTLRQMLADHGVRLADYRMDQGLLSQQRQPGQDNAAGAQQFGAAFGQGNGQQDGRQTGTGQRSTTGDMTASGNGPAAVSGSTGGQRGVGNTASNSRLDLFA